MDGREKRGAIHRLGVQAAINNDVTHLFRKGEEAMGWLVLAAGVLFGWGVILIIAVITEERP